ncbi:hypothetical protein sync_1605 [Synechococcus sp. CC9311]|nr:hypothetical protein sync_1605 [Synechococcus sp. CC9311]
MATQGSAKDGLASGDPEGQLPLNPQQMRITCNFAPFRIELRTILIKLR